MFPALHRKMSRNQHSKIKLCAYQTLFCKPVIYCYHNGKTSTINSINLITSNENLFFMKKAFGLCILVILFLVAMGCTQPAPSSPATTTTTPVETTTAVPVETTAMPVESVTPATMVEENATMAMANVTSPVNETPAETTVPQTPAPAQTPLVTAIVIHIQNSSFVPAVTTVLPGTGITWINDDTITHSVKATGAHEGMFNSGDIAPGARWGFDFVDVGSYGYSDPNFPQVNGTIVIQKAKTLSDYTPAPVQTTA